MLIPISRLVIPDPTPLIPNPTYLVTTPCSSAATNTVIKLVDHYFWTFLEPLVLHHGKRNLDNILR